METNCASSPESACTDPAPSVAKRGAPAYRPDIDHSDYLRRAVELGAETVRLNRGGPFGAVVVRDGVIVGEGANRVIGTNDPTAHAEVVAIRDACSRLGTFLLSGATIYASSEPCPMCLASVYWARIDRIFYSTDRVQVAAIGFDDEFFYQELAKPVDARGVGMRRIELPDAAALLEGWRTKIDKIPY